MYLSIKKISHWIAREKKKRYLKNLISNGLNIGKNVEIVSDFFFDPSHCYLISIGDNCTICPGVRLIAHDASTKSNLGYTKIGKIDIEKNCFIGDSTIILPGVTIGQNSIIGAGSVVTRNVPQNTIAAGNPADVLSTIGEYKNKIEAIAKNKKIFAEDYFINNLNEKKRREIIESIGNNLGFIV